MKEATKNTTEFSVSIPNPCHEKWENMQPVKEGAYCGACSKVVQDFSNRTYSEIREFFENKPAEQKVCGRFSTAQLISMNFDGFFARFRLWSFTRRIAVIFFFVFGALMFSCNFRTTGEITEHPVGKVSMEDTLASPDTSVLIVQPPDSGTDNK